jgi:hypothetical protein
VNVENNGILYSFSATFFADLLSALHSLIQTLDLLLGRLHTLE